MSAAEIIETELWQQYNELGGIQDSEVPGGTGNPAYTNALEMLDSDMSQYVHDNTEDEFTHFTFINAYLAAHGAQTVNLDRFRTLPSSTATGAQQIGRLTNLMQLTGDTSWWTRYRSRTKNPDFGDTFLAQRVTHHEVLRILLSVGPTETMHFQTWQDKAGNAPPVTDPTTGLTFPDLNSPPFGGEDFQTNLIMPEPTIFLDRKFPVCSIIRPTHTNGAAMDTLQALTADGLFKGQSPEFFATLTTLAMDADAARHGGIGPGGHGSMGRGSHGSRGRHQ